MTENLLKTHHSRCAKLINCNKFQQDVSELVIKYTLIWKILQYQTNGIDGVNKQRDYFCVDNYLRTELQLSDYDVHYIENVDHVTLKSLLYLLAKSRCKCSLAELKYIFYDDLQDEHAVTTAALTFYCSSH